MDVSDFGGTVREYQVRVDPNKLVSYGLSIGQVEQQLANNNINAGGSFVEVGLQQMNVRALGLFSSVQDIEQTVLKTQSGTALRVKDIAEVTQGPKIRLGHMARANHMEDGRIIDEPDVIQGAVLMRKGAEEQPTLDAIHKKVDELNNGILPPGVKVVPMLDRSDLLHFTLHTVMHNLVEGHDPGHDHPLPISLQCSRRSDRRAYHSILAAVRVHLAGLEPHSRQSSFAGRAGFRNGGGWRGGHGGKHRPPFEPPQRTRAGGHRDRTTRRRESIREACHEVQRPVFYAIAIIITAYHAHLHAAARGGPAVPAHGLDRGLRPAGRLTFSILIAPVLASVFFRSGVREWRNPVMDISDGALPPAAALGRRASLGRTVGVGVAALARKSILGFSGVIGSEFLPHLDEGAIWARGTLANSTSLTEGERFTNNCRYVFASFPEVKTVVSQAGRPDDGTDTGGFGNTEYFVDLKPHDQWRPVFHKNKEELIAAMDRALQKYPGRDLELLAAN